MKIRWLVLGVLSLGLVGCAATYHPPSLTEEDYQRYLKLVLASSFAPVPNYEEISMLIQTAPTYDEYLTVEANSKAYQSYLAKNLGVYRVDFSFDKVFSYEADSQEFRSYNLGSQFASREVLRSRTYVGSNAFGASREVTESSYQAVRLGIMNMYSFYKRIPKIIEKGNVSTNDISFFMFQLHMPPQEAKAFAETAKNEGAKLYFKPAFVAPRSQHFEPTLDKPSSLYLDSYMLFADYESVVINVGDRWFRLQRGARTGFDLVALDLEKMRLGLRS